MVHEGPSGGSTLTLAINCTGAWQRPQPSTEDRYVRNCLLTGLYTDIAKPTRLTQSGPLGHSIDYHTDVGHRAGLRHAPTWQLR
jgi:hypothetical protein